MAQVTAEAPTVMPPAARLLIGLVATAALALFTVLLVAVWHVRGPVGLDHALVDPAHAWTPLPLLLRVVRLGSPTLVFLVTGVLLFISSVRRDWFAVALCAVGPVAAGLSCELVLKPLVDRLDGSALSFPSGHTTLAAALGTLVVVLACRFWRGWLAAIVAVPAAVLPLVVAFAVVGLRWHFPTDAVGGIALGVGVVLGTAAVLSRPTIWKNRTN